jgi:hypothetical protein
MVLYRNGAEVSRNSNITASFPKQWMTIGAHNDGVNAMSNLNGRISQVRLYNRALSAAEIDKNWNSTAPS